jgi:hypothetical protein
MKRVLLSMGIAMLALASWAQANQAADAKPSAPSSEQAAIQLAASLVTYGEQTQQALPFIQALQILKDNPLQAQAMPKEGETPNKPGTQLLDYNAVLAQAKAFAAGDAHLLAVIDQIDKNGERGDITGPNYHEDVVQAGRTDVYTITFRGGELAEVGVVGDGDTDLDLYVYDENDNLIAKDIDYGDDCYVSWTPSWTGAFKIKIKNLGNVYNSYVLITN